MSQGQADDIVYVCAGAKLEDEKICEDSSAIALLHLHGSEGHGVCELGLTHVCARGQSILHDRSKLLDRGGTTCSAWIERRV